MNTAPTKPLKLSDIPKDEPIYISCAMSKFPDLGKSRLDRAEHALSIMGFTNILNPYKMVNQEIERTWAECLEIDVRDIMVRKCRNMVLLDNYVGSNGAYLEVHLFISLNFNIFNESGVDIKEDVARYFNSGYHAERFLSITKVNGIC